VFLDVDSIMPGTDFERQIEEGLDSSAVLLVIIGRDWQRPEGDRRGLEDPADFVRLEVSLALAKGIPTVPVLIDSTPMPPAEDLPEPMRPLVRMQAVRLSSANWDLDISRVIDVVIRHIDSRSGPPKWRTWRALSVAGIVVAALAAVIVVVINLVAPSPSRVPAVSAIAAVRAVAVPDRLTMRLLNTPLMAADIPQGTSAEPARLSGVVTGAQSSGLTAEVRVIFSGPAAELEIDYLVFDKISDATSRFYSHGPLPNNYSATGQHFASPGVRDPTDCRIGTDATGLSWACQTLSGNVVSTSEIVESNGSSGAELEMKMAVDAIRHLQATAGSVPSPPTLVPASGSTASLRADTLEARLSRPFPASLIPLELGSDVTVTTSVADPSPPGLFQRKRITVASAASGSDFSNNFMFFYVFNTAGDALSWFQSGLHPGDKDGNPYISTSGITFPSGFSAQQQIRCGNYMHPGAHSGPAAGFTICYTLWGNVVIESVSALVANQQNSEPGSADANIPISLARSALLRIEQVATS
jgi:hypothetical protein